MSTPPLRNEMILASAGSGKTYQLTNRYIGLMAAGRIDEPAVARGIAFLLATQNGEGLWDEGLFTAVGFPRVFYLRYHGYAKFFPLWAIARCVTPELA